MTTPAPIKIPATALAATVAALVTGIAAVVEGLRTHNPTATAAGAAEISATVWTFVNSHDRRLAASLTLDAKRAEAWVGQNFSLIEQVVRQLTPVLDSIPGLPQRQAALEQAVEGITAKVSATTGVDVDALAAAVRDKLVAGSLASGPQTAPTPPQILPAPSVVLPAPPAAPGAPEPAHTVN